MELHAAPFPLLTVLILLPFVGAALVAFVPRTREELIRPLGLGFSLATGVLAVYLLTQFQKGEAGFQFVSRHPWIRDLGISWNLGVDGISLFLVVLTGVLFPVALFGPDERHRIKSYTAWILLLEAGVMGVFLSLDLFLFFVFFEVVLVPMYFLIAGWGHGNKTYAATKFFLYTMAGSALLLVATLALVFITEKNTGTRSFDLVTLAEGGGVGQTTARWLFLAFALAFAVKVPIFPLHTWLPDAHTEAPTAGSVILAGVMLKMGTYGLVRFGLYLFPEASDWFAPVMLTLGVVGIIYGALVATVQKDLKRLVAYSSVAHLGFIIVGTFAFTTQGLTGGVLQNVNHGLSTGALFLLVGWVYERRHTREIAELKGMWKAAPMLGGVFLVVLFSSIGLPGLNGFVGEFLILSGTFVTRRWWAVAAATGVILAAVYMLWAFQRTFQGEPDEETCAHLHDLTWRERAAILPLVGLIVFLGVYPKPVLERIEPSVKALLTHVQERSRIKEPAVAAGGASAEAASAPEAGEEGK